MKDFKGKVAVITGAASDIGRGIAERCMQEGMKIVLADIEEAILMKTEEEMQEAGVDVLAALTEVSQAKDVEKRAQRTLDAFGAVHLFFNNAGVTAGATVWEYTLDDWKWVLGVSLWGAINGVRTFVPIMIEQNVESHIINTASTGGLITYPASRAYLVSKHGIVDLAYAPIEKIVTVNYLLAGITPVTSAGELADIVRKRVPGVKIRFEPNQNFQSILDKLLLPLDDTNARKEWHWKPGFNQEQIVDDFINELNQNPQLYE